MSINTHTLIIGALVIIALIVLAIVIVRQYQERQSQRLRQRFGPEYGRVVAAHGNTTKAESELLAREKRVSQLNIVPLAPSDAARFSEAWAQLQSRFVDTPRGVVAEADTLVRELMLKRGYPIGDFERRAADISVDHPRLVITYRAAQEIAARDRKGGDVSTEDLRKAVVHYRQLFDELLEVRKPAPGVEVSRKPEVVES